MKPTLIITLVAALFFTGCTTVPSTPEQKVRRVASIAQLAAYDGTVLWLKTHPEHRPAFVAAHEALVSITTSGPITPESFLSALSQLPIKELQGPNGSLIVGNAVILFDAFLNENVSIDTQKIEPIVIAVRDGLGKGLGL